MNTPLVSVLMTDGRRTARLLGRPTRVGGVAIAAEVAISQLHRTDERTIQLEDGAVAHASRVGLIERYTLVELAFVAPMNREAEALLAGEVWCEGCKGAGKLGASLPCNDCQGKGVR